MHGADKLTVCVPWVALGLTGGVWSSDWSCHLISAELGYEQAYS